MKRRLARLLRVIADRLDPRSTPASIHIVHRDETPIGGIFKRLGGLTPVSRILGKGVSTISEMKRRGSVPVAYWPALIAAAGDAELAERDGRLPFTLTNDMMVAAHTGTPADAEQTDAAA